jgi:hypothetical protein
VKQGVVYAYGMKLVSKAASCSAIGSLLVALLFTSDPVRAKCPRNFVQVHGKIECTFKPDYKVLVTLIYSEHQPEAFGEETALDLRGSSFKGEVAFDTFVSYNPITGGHKCSRKPKGVLVRLIAADGTEWDRKDLKIADAFSYEEEKGRYAIRSDLILHGWCEPKCAEGTSAPCGNPK